MLLSAIFVAILILGDFSAFRTEVGSIVSVWPQDVLKLSNIDTKSWKSIPECPLKQRGESSILPNF